MKRNRIRLLSFLLLMVMCMSTFTVTVFAYGEDPEGDSYVEETAPPTEATPDNVLTPEGNMTLVDDIQGEDAADKQFITVTSKGGHYFYIIIDRADSGENTVHFLNQVDEADLLALIEEEQTNTTPLVCVCTEKCTAGAIHTSCEICMTTMSKCVGKEVEPAPTEPAEPATSNSAGAFLSLLLILGMGDGAAYYFLIRKPKQTQNIPSDFEDFDLEDEEEYIDDDNAE